MFSSIQLKLINLIDAGRSQFRDIPSKIRSWYTLLIIFAVLLLSTIIGMYITQQLALYTFLAIGAIVATLIFLKTPPMGLIVLIIGAFLVPSPFTSGSLGLLNPALLIMVLLSVIWIFDMFVRQRQINLVHSKTMIPAIVFMIISLIAFLNGQLIYTSFVTTAPIIAQIGGLGLFIFSIIAFILTANQIMDLIWLKRLTWIFITLGTIFIFSSLSPPVIERLISPRYQYGSHDTSIFWIWLVMITASQALYNHNLKTHWRLLLIVILVATFYVSFNLLYFWKSSWLPPLIGLGTIIWIGSKRFRIPILLISFFVLVFTFSNISGFFTGGEDYSLLTRGPAYRIVLEIFKLNPIFGVGIANYYWYTPIYQILGYTGLSFSSHNNYIDILAQMGIVGLLGFIWLFWAIGRLGLQLKNRVPAGFEYAYVVGAIGGLVATLASGMLGDWIIPFVYNVGLNGFRSSLLTWIFLGGLVTLEQTFLKSGDEKEIMET